MIANTFIVGVQKSGTTFLHELLSQHPQIFCSRQKEPSYFIAAFNDPENLFNLKRPLDRKHVGLETRHSACYATLQRYESLFEGAADFKIRLESSTNYFASPYAPARIKEANPNARIIIILREPKDRAFSAYWYQRSLGLETTSTFLEALEEELAGSRNDWLYGWRYLNMGRYETHLARYYSLFQESSVLKLQFSEFMKDPIFSLTRVCEFLGVDLSYKFENQAFRNSTHLLSSRIARRAREFLHIDSSVKSAVKPFLSVEARLALKNLIDKWFLRLPSRKPRLSNREEAILNSYFGDNYSH